MFQIFKSVLLLSGAGAVLTIVLLLIKPISEKRFSSAWRYYIWLVVLAVMILPIRLPKKAVEVDLTNVTDSVVAGETTYVQSEPPPIAETDTGEPVTAAATKKRAFRLNGYDVISFVWLAGAVIFMLSALLSYRLFIVRKRRASEQTEACEEFLYAKDKMGIKRNIALRKSEDIDAPMLTGVFRPVIYVPERAIDREELVMIFMHELTHYKRRDLWYKWFALAVNALHWFNPLMYIAAANINEYCELSCDDCVTRDMNGEQKKKYMNTIIGLIRKGERRNV